MDIIYALKIENFTIIKFCSAYLSQMGGRNLASKNFRTWQTFYEIWKRQYLLFSTMILTCIYFSYLTSCFFSCPYFGKGHFGNTQLRRLLLWGRGALVLTASFQGIKQNTSTTCLKETAAWVCKQA